MHSPRNGGAKRVEQNPSVACWIRAICVGGDDTPRVFPMWFFHCLAEVKSSCGFRRSEVGMNTIRESAGLERPVRIEL